MFFKHLKDRLNLVTSRFHRMTYSYQVTLMSDHEAYVYSFLSSFVLTVTDRPLYGDKNKTISALKAKQKLKIVQKAAKSVQ